jgi:hypothetical protein
MRFDTTQHKAYCGIDLHARTMYVCIVNHDGEILVHQNCKASPEISSRALLRLVMILSSRLKGSSRGIGWLICVRAKVWPSSSGRPSTGKPSMAAKPKTTAARRRTVPCSYAGACPPRRMCSLRRCAPRATSSGAGCI